VEPNAPITQSESEAAVRIQEFAIRGDIVERPLHHITANMRAAPLDAASKPMQHLHGTMVLQGDANLIQEPVGALLDAVRCSVREELEEWALGGLDDGTSCSQDKP
jgi:hypothetical protein